VPIACGADSVASALHLRLGATPRGRAQIIMTLRAGRSKAELLILHKTGTSHFALTLVSLALTGSGERASITFYKFHFETKRETLLTFLVANVIFSRVPG
jgi:hypothetical protein